MDVQTRWDTSPGSLEPRVINLPLTVVLGADVGSLENFENRPNHTVLVALHIAEQGDQIVVVKSEPKVMSSRHLFALSPEIAWNLACQLQEYADALEQEAPDEVA